MSCSTYCTGSLDGVNKSEALTAQTFSEIAALRGLRTAAGRQMEDSQGGTFMFPFLPLN